MALSTITADIPGHGQFKAPSAVYERLSRELAKTTLFELRRLVAQTTGVKEHARDATLNRPELLCILADADPNSVRMLEEEELEQARARRARQERADAIVAEELAGLDLDAATAAAAEPGSPGYVPSELENAHHTLSAIAAQHPHDRVVAGLCGQLADILGRLKEA